MPPKKNIKLNVSELLNDDAFGGSGESWADDFDADMLKPSSSVALDVGLVLDEPVIPDAPPYTIRISAFPPQTDAVDIKEFFEEGLKIADLTQVLDDFFVPRDVSMKQYAFVTFKTRDLLIDALALNNRPLHGQPAYVSVAKPSKNPRNGDRSSSRPMRSDVEWSGARGSSFNSLPSRANDFSRGPREPRQEVEWGGARGSAFNSLPQREDRPAPRGPPREPRQEVEWGGARGSAFNSLPQRENRPAPRGPPKEKKETAELTWSRGSATSIPKKEPIPATKSVSSRKPQDSFDWGSARSSAAAVPNKKPVEEGESSTEALTAATKKLALQEEDGWNRV